MPERHGFCIEPVTGRSLVGLRVLPGAGATAAEVLNLPQQAGTWLAGNTDACWLGPDQWLLCSDRVPADEITANIHRLLAGQFHASTDLSSAYACFTLSGAQVRTVLAMGCGLDLHPEVFRPGHCARTRFAEVLVLLVAADSQFTLYLDRSHARYITDWFAQAVLDPLTQRVHNKLWGI